jgi:hypothetical protein
MSRFITHPLSVAGLLSVLLGGCYRSNIPPELDVRKAFPELSGLSGASPDKLADQMISGLAGDETASQDLFEVGNGMVAGMPASEGWSWAKDDTSTLLVHMTDDVADAIFFAELFDPVAIGVSENMRSFQYTVDVNMGRKASMTDMALERTALKADANYDTGKVLLAIRAVRSRTLGRGFGYSSAKDSFTGWKWHGLNQKGIELRLGRTQGDWVGVAQVGEDVRANATWITENLSGLAELSAALGKADEYEAALGEMSPRSAWMILGTAQSGETTGVQFAILCAQSPSCDQAQDLATMLDTIQAGDGTEISSGTEMSTLAQKAGIVLVEEEDLIDEEALIEMLSSASGSSSGEEASDSESGEGSTEAGDAEPAGDAESEPESE